MKWTILSIVVLACLRSTLVQAEALRVSFEWIELDCSECPGLAARFQPRPGYVGSANARDPAFVELRERARERVIARHEQWVELGKSAQHSARLDKRTSLRSDSDR